MDKMTFGEYKAQYIATFRRWMDYGPQTVGSIIYAEKMGELYDAHPDWADLVESDPDFTGRRQGNDNASGERRVSGKDGASGRQRL
jgi:hypothetical protein